jgi:hypothetical protein
MSIFPPLRLTLLTLTLAVTQVHAADAPVTHDFLIHTPDDSRAGRQPIVPHWYSNTNDDIENLPIVGDGQHYIPAGKAKAHKTLGLLPLCYSEAKKKRVPCGVSMPERPRREQAPMAPETSVQQST